MSIRKNLNLEFEKTGKDTSSQLSHLHRIPLPTPFPVGTINVYLLTCEPLTLIDTGPLTDATFDSLKGGFEALGRSLSDIKRILLTHGHVDHVGLARRLREISGAKIYLHEGDKPLLEKLDTSCERLLSVHEPLAKKSGVPEFVLGQLKSLYSNLSKFGEATNADVYLKDGDEIEFSGGTLRTVHTPGHSAGSVCFLWSQDQILFSGDTLLSHITPNAFFKGELAHSGIGLITYLHSLDRVESLHARQAYCGHGPDVSDVASLISNIRFHHDARKTEILSILRKGPMNAAVIVQRVFPNIELREMWLAFAEVMGHLELLESEGLVRRFLKDAMLLFELT